MQMRCKSNIAAISTVYMYIIYIYSVYVYKYIYILYLYVQHCAYVYKCQMYIYIEIVYVILAILSTAINVDVKDLWISMESTGSSIQTTTPQRVDNNH